MNVGIERVDQSALAITLLGGLGGESAGFDFPEVNQALRRPGLVALGVAPGKALVVSSQAVAPAEGFSALDLSDARVLFELSGSEARALVAKGTGFAVEDPSFDAGRCAMTRLAGVAVLIEPLSPERLRLHVSSTYAQHVEEWLRDAALERGDARER